LISPARVHALLRPPAAVLRAYVQWFGVDVPQDLPAGDYTGTITINLDAVSQEAAAAVFKVALTVQGGEPIPNAGADDLWRMSRLGWLDSTVGIDRNITAGFDELQLSTESGAMTATLTGGRTLSLGKSPSGGGVTVIEAIHVQEQPV